MRRVNNRHRRFIRGGIRAAHFVYKHRRRFIRAAQIGATAYGAYAGARAAYGVGRGLYGLASGRSVVSSVLPATRFNSGTDAILGKYRPGIPLITRRMRNVANDVGAPVRKFARSKYIPQIAASKARLRLAKLGHFL